MKLMLQSQLSYIKKQYNVFLFFLSRKYGQARISMYKKLLLKEKIQDSEWLYRSFPVPDQKQEKIQWHHTIIDGKLRITKSAWNDRHGEPSVDRAVLIASPEDIKFNQTDAVIKIRAKQIRSLSNNNLNINNTTCIIDVKFDRTKERPAHSKIFSAPPMEGNQGKKKFNILKELLAIEASKHGWVLKPQHTPETWEGS